MPVDEIFEEIYGNWYDGLGPCEGCPNRDEDRYWKPSLYKCDPNAELALISQAPRDDHPDDDKEDPLGTTSEDRQRQHFKRECEPARNLERRKVDRWLFYHPETGDEKRIPYYFLDMLEGDFTPDDGLYYTNAKKCADVEGGNNSTARRKCKNYLGPELEFVNPDVIVPFGNRAVSAVCELYDVDSRGVTSMVFDHYGNGSSIVPSVHWSHLQQNLSDIDAVEHRQGYWKKLADTINEAYRTRS